MLDTEKYERDTLGYQVLEYKVPLGNDRSAVLRIPSNLSATEADRLAAMIKTLPIDHRT